MCGKNFSIYGVHILPKCIECIIFTDVPVPNLKLQIEFFENLFSPKTGRGEGSYDLLHQNLIRQYEDDFTVLQRRDISLFKFCMICNLSKCDDFTVLQISIKSNSVILSLLATSSLQPW